MPRERLNEKRQRAIRILGSFKDFRPAYQIAKDLGINRKTLYRWRQEPGFAEEVNKRLSEHFPIELLQK